WLARRRQRRGVSFWQASLTVIQRDPYRAIHALCLFSLMGDAPLTPSPGPDPWLWRDMQGAGRGLASISLICKMTKSTAPDLSVPRQPAVASRRELWLVFAGLMLSIMLAALDQSIVNTALPQMASDLGGLAHLSWVVTAFMLCSTIATPIYGKLGDMYGRRRLLTVSIVVFLIASMLCGLAQSMPQLILFRALQ